MNDLMTQAKEEHGELLDEKRLIEAVRGSRAARVLFALRSWLLRSDFEIEKDSNTPAAY